MRIRLLVCVTFALCVGGCYSRQDSLGVVLFLILLALAAISVFAKVEN